MWVGTRCFGIIEEKQWVGTRCLGIIEMPEVACTEQRRGSPRDEAALLLKLREHPILNLGAQHGIARAFLTS